MKSVIKLSIIIIMVLMNNVLFEMSNKRFGVAFCGGMVCLTLILIVDRILINIKK